MASRTTFGFFPDRAISFRSSCWLPLPRSQRYRPALGVDPLGEPGGVTAIPAAVQLVDPPEQSARIGERPVAGPREVLRRYPLAGLDLADLHGVENGKVAYEHIYWDQVSVLVQLGLLDPTGLPVAGREAAAKLLDPAIPGPHL